MKLLKFGAKGSAVSELQQLLIKNGMKGKNNKPLSIDGHFGESTEYAVIQYQRKIGIKVDGIVGNATFNALKGQDISKNLKDADLTAGAKRLGVPEIVIRAIAEVETQGEGYLPDGRPKILFERHRMYFYLSQKRGKAFADKMMSQYPNVINTQTGGYHGNAAEYTRLALAKQIENKEQLFYLILDSESTIGFIGIEHNYKNEAITKIHKIYLLPETQGKGYGKIVFESIEKFALENKSNELLLNVNRFNTALNFYKKLGFEIKETVDIEIGNGYLMEDYVMGKQISN